MPAPTWVLPDLGCKHHAVTVLVRLKNLREPQITLGYPDVVADLFTQGFGRGELDFGAEAAEKEHFHFRVLAEIDGMEIQ